MRNSLQNLVKAGVSLCALCAALSVRQVFALDGEVPVHGGGAITFTNAAETNYLGNADGTTDLLIKFLPAEDAGFTFPGTTKAQILAVGGGGGGGGIFKNLADDIGGGGGGGGGAVLETNAFFEAGNFSVSVGAGGAGGKAVAVKAQRGTDATCGKEGKPTTVSRNGVKMLSAAGGGGGGGEAVGGDGSSGGGGSQNAIFTIRTCDGGNGTVGLGYKGGNGDVALYGGGGGGAGGEGGNASDATHGVGGIGKICNITLAYDETGDVYYGGGGGGGYADEDESSTSESDAIDGGNGGGGHGGYGAEIAPKAGASGTGGGGGGAGADGSAGGAGGSGVVYVRVSLSLASSEEFCKPKDLQLEYNGATQSHIDETSPFYELTAGVSGGKEPGVYTGTAKPKAGLVWPEDGTADGGTANEVTVTLTIYQAGSLSGTATVTGAPVEYFGASAVTWVENSDSTKDLLLTFTGVGGYKLPGTSQVKMLAVGGGGGGGGTFKNYDDTVAGGGGGGGGGVVYSDTTIRDAATFSVSVGGGGGGGKLATTARQRGGEAISGGNGTNTVIWINGEEYITAVGGGGGGGETHGKNGASGGGGSRLDTEDVADGGTGISGQGYNGGKGDVAQYGGGGGGAGGEGGNAGDANHGVGGIGKICNITLGYGETGDVYYGAGGGGGYVNEDETTTAAENSVAGGKGGGGHGGYGNNIKPQSGVPGTGGGGGGSDGNNGGANGGSGIVIVRISSAMEGTFRKPDPVVEYVYDGQERMCVQPSGFWTVEGDNVGKDVGEYKVRVTPNGVHWPDDDSSAAVEVTMKILPCALTVESISLENWEYGTATAKTPNPVCVTVPAFAVNDLVYEYATTDGEDWSAEKPTLRGIYRVRAGLKPEVAANYEFDQSAAPTATFAVTPIPVVFLNLAIRDWMQGTPLEETPNPTCSVVRSDNGKPVKLTPIYEYAERIGTATNTWAWSVNKPTAAGSYVVRARAPDAVNYDFVFAYLDFEILAGRGDLFMDWVDITNIVGTGMSPFPFVVALSEAKPTEAGKSPFGFLYSRTAAGGEAMMFTDQDGNVLPYAVMEWDEQGESRLCVRLASISNKPQSIRLYWNLRDSKTVPDHTYEDYSASQVPATQPTSRFGLVCRDGLLVNYFVEDPAMDKVEWDADNDEPGKITNYGRLAEGKVAVVYRNSATGEILDDMPEHGGVYRIIFSPVDPRGIYEPLEARIDIRLTGRYPVDNLRGTEGGSETRNGRVLLMNDDGASGHEITGQGYWNWEHSGEHNASLLNTDFPFLLAGANHELKSIGEDGLTKVIWVLDNVMIGNCAANRTSGPYIRGTRNSLPWSPTSKSVTNDSVTASTMADAGNIVMRNRKGAAVISPVYQDGIGTIYFDAVNLSADGAPDGYGLAVEVSTNDNEWVAQTVYPLKREGTPNFVAEAATKELKLGITTSGTDNNFYRVYVPVNYYGPAKFRIKRTATVNTSTITEENDNGGFILIDNIIVSYPKAIAETVAYGEYDGGISGALALGQKGAMMTPFPAVGEEIFARAKPTAAASSLTNSDPRAFISLCTMHYRWRYLNQIIGDWKQIELQPASNYIAAEPLDLPSIEGDVEFWFETQVQAPFYSYYDYSGKGIGLEGSGYTEEVTMVTNRMNDATGTLLASGGNDWFFRLRENKSNYEAVQVAVEGADWLREQKIDMRLVGNRLWRGFLKTPTEAAGKVKFRISAVNLQTPGETDYNHEVKYWRSASEEPVKFGVDGDSGLVVCGEDEWSELEVDNLTSHAVLQFDDNSMTFTVVHGDYQDFNSWSDANKKDGQGLFVGSYNPLTKEGDGAASGSSDRTRRMSAGMSAWRPSVSVNSDWWSESFIVNKNVIGTGDYVLGRSFGGITTPNGWRSGPGMWAAERYNDSTSGLALQMEGCGYGYLQFVDAGKTPRGIGQISFRARLAQFRGFEDFCWWYGCTPSIPYFENYTFMTLAAFDTNNAKDFAGAGSVSVVAHYDPYFGCYEFRVTQKKANTAGTGPGDEQTLQLMRWNRDANGFMSATELCSADINHKSVMHGTSEANLTFPQLFISCSNDTDDSTIICAGVSKELKSPNAAVNDTFITLTYRDNSADRCTAGTFGVGSANCPARFCDLRWCEGSTLPAAANIPAAGVRDKSKTLKENQPVSVSSSALKMCASGSNNFKRGWMLGTRVMEIVEDETSISLRGFQAGTIPQELHVFTAPSGTQNWSSEPIAKFTVSGFGAAGSQTDFSTNVCGITDCSVKIAVGSKYGDPRCDIIIDDVQIEQWRGESFDNGEGSVVFPSSESYYGVPTNFVYTQAWIVSNETTHAIHCQLNAKRSDPSVATSIRSPLFDGKDGRGIGLGLFGFSYVNAQKNAKLLVQVATNKANSSQIDATTLRGISMSVSESEWTTLETIDFSTMSEEDRRRGGTRSYYLGLHGAQGVMRLVLDPATVAAVANETDPDLFGSVEIVSVECTDEPEVDERSWWGWNLRTTDATDMTWIGDQPTLDSLGGMAFGLNNSVTEDVRVGGGIGDAAYRQHLPFLQTPALTGNLIGEVTFKARLYNKTDPKTFVTLYGADNGSAPDTKWELLETFEITSDIYQTCTYRMPQGTRKAVLRLAVVGVDGIRNEGTDVGYMPESHPSQVEHAPVRVLIDEVMICESLDARVRFRNVRPFRFGLDNALTVTDIMSPEEQPLVGEAWGVQAEIHAAQLAEEVDLSRAEVYLWWYEGTNPWGFEQWRNSPGAHRERMQPSSDNERVYRSSYATCQNAVVPLTPYRETMQYMMEVIWRPKNAKDRNVVVTNWMDRTDWVKPKWYSGIDYNAQFGNDAENAFSGYTLLDTVAPNWAWINEVNIFGAYDNDGINTDVNYQYIEIAAPSDADLEDWKIRMLLSDPDNHVVYTNTIATFGVELKGMKEPLLNQASGMVFRVVASPQTVAAGKLDASKGQVDGEWNFDNPDGWVMDVNGTVLEVNPIGIQLVRASDVVDHEIVLVGTNAWGNAIGIGERFHPTNTVNELNQVLGTSNFFYAGDDDGGTNRSLSVCRSKGGSSNCWDRAMIHTPGSINTYLDGTPQQIPALPARAAGATVLIYCNLDPSGYIAQTVGAAEDSTYDQIVVLPKGSETGTNITYTVAKWHDLASVTTNGVALPASELHQIGSRQWSVNVGKGASNNVTVVASAGISETLRELGVTDNNRYKAAIMDWLVKGKDMFGRSWPDSDGEVYRADFRALNFNFVTNLTLTEMYWLDICPTIPNQHLVGGMKKAPEARLVRASSSSSLSGVTRLNNIILPSDSILTNVKVSVSLMVTNTNPIGTSQYREAYSPYVIRGVEPGYTSWDFKEDKTGKVWNSATFKIAGLLADSELAPFIAKNEKWLPLKKFLFVKDSFYQADCGDPDRVFTAEIQVEEPSTPGSVGDSFWGTLVRQHLDGKWPTIFYRWELNERSVGPYGVEILQPENYLDP